MRVTTDDRSKRYALFRAGEQVQVGTQRTYDGVTYRCLQAHTSISSWYPPVAPALWAVA
jgi:hypothetical protein